jgi:TolB-like protein/Flp pilus assembly protein TadD/tRNA A-37 threonylcarbamoyl transferase component Bud32
MDETELEQLVTALSGRYVLEGVAGRGASATVFRAIDLRLDRPVALKLLHARLGLALGPERFHREIRTAAHLQHPHILPLFDSGEAAGHLYYTMPYVETGTLRDRLDREGPLPVADVLRIGRELSDALAYAHATGIIHRDIKPENIALSAAGHAMLADFGIARATGGGAASVTAEGLAVGTPAYMSPEQVTGQEPIDGRADVYALGAVLYEALTGCPPFPGSDAEIVMRRRLLEPPPSARAKRPEVPAAVDAALRKAMDRREERHQSAAAFGAALTAQSAAPAGDWAARLDRLVAGRRRWAAAALLLLAVGAAALGARYLGRGRAAPSEGPPMLAVLPFKYLGPPADRYFADGLTEEITSRLAGLSGLRVISRTSADQYRQTTKALKEIGAELGVGYVLEGSVRWDRSEGRGRVRVTSQLIRVADDSPLWADTYDAEVNRIFALQAGIAEQVASALDLALRPPERAGLATGGTADPEAYDYYIRGNDYLSRGNTRPTLSAAVELYRRAVARDPRFALAFARLSNAHSQMYWYGHDEVASRIALAKAAADSALALAPDLPEARVALGFYYYRGFRDYTRALEHFEAARRRQPHNGDLLAGIGFVQRRRGRWDEAIVAFSEAARSDPRSNLRAFDLGSALSSVGRFAEAERELERAITLGPEWGSPYAQKAQVYLAWRGDLTAARAVLKQAASRMGLGQLTQGLVSNDQTAHTLFTSDSASGPVVDALTLSAFTGDTLRYYFLKAESARFRRLPAAERAYADSVRALIQARLRRRPDDPFLQSWLGIAYAALGRKADAIRVARRAIEVMPPSRDALQGPYFAVALAQTYMMVDQPDLAIETLEPLLEIPSPITREALRADPLWTPLRGHARFRALIAAGDER